MRQLPRRDLWISASLVILGLNGPGLSRAWAQEPAAGADKPVANHATTTYSNATKEVELLNTVEGIYQSKLLAGHPVLQNNYDMVVTHSPQEQLLGATFEPAGAALRAQLNLPEGQGLVVTSLAEDGPAARSGLKINDVLLEMGGPIADIESLQGRMQAAGENKVDLQLRREGKPLTIAIRPSIRVTFGPGELPRAEGFIGVRVTTPEAALRAQLQLPADRGLVVVEVIPASPAARAGLKTHDVLTELGDKPLSAVETLVNEVKAARGQSIDLKLVRAGAAMTLKVTPETRGQQASSYVPTWQFWRVNDGTTVALDAYFSQQPTTTPNFMGWYQIANPQTQRANTTEAPAPAVAAPAPRP